MTFLNAVRKRRLIAKETSIANCGVLDTGKALHRCSSGASVKVTDLLFAFAFCKKQTRKTAVLARLAVCRLRFRLINLASQVFRSAVKQQHK